jgi:hypothetical protein
MPIFRIEGRYAVGGGLKPQRKSWWCESQTPFNAAQKVAGKIGKAESFNVRRVARVPKGKPLEP